MSYYWKKNITELECVPINFSNWMSKPYILSKAMRPLCEELILRILKMEHQQIDDDEYTYLSLYGKVDPTPLVRQISLLGDNIPFSFARVVIPEQTLNANKRKFNNLGNGLLGEKILYNNPDVTRTKFEYAQLSANNILFQHANNFFSELKKSKHLFARRSVFLIKNNPLLITEVFLPNIPKLQVSNK